MPDRTVKLGSMAYIDPSGRPRRANHGETVQVHPDHVERFDRLNVLMGQEPEKPAAKPAVETPVAVDKPADPVVKRSPGRPRKVR